MKTALAAIRATTLVAAMALAAAGGAQAQAGCDAPYGCADIAVDGDGRGPWEALPSGGGQGRLLNAAVLLLIEGLLSPTLAAAPGDAPRRYRDYSLRVDASSEHLRLEVGLRF